MLSYLPCVSSQNHNYPHCVQHEIRQKFLNTKKPGHMINKIFIQVHCIVISSLCQDASSPGCPDVRLTDKSNFKWPLGAHEELMCIEEMREPFDLEFIHQSSLSQYASLTLNMIYWLSIWFIDSQYDLLEDSKCLTSYPHTQFSLLIDPRWISSWWICSFSWPWTEGFTLN